MRSIADILILVVTVAAAVVIGFGVPLLWVWIGSQLQGTSGATSLNFSVAVAILIGIIVTYGFVLYLAGWVMTRVEPGPQRPGTARSPWMRGMTDTRQRPRQPGPQMGGIERLFVTTTLIVTAAFWVWFLFLAGSPLPNQ